jgi:hypothetical protein
LIRIISRKEGFCRCGVKHSENPVSYPNNYFTSEQLKQLKTEPMLIVDVFPDPSSKYLTDDHITLMKKVAPEIRLIDKSIKRIGVSKPLNNKESRPDVWQQEALKCFHQNQESFNFIKVKYLQDKRLFELMDHNSKNRPKELFGELLNKIFEAEGLSKLDKLRAIWPEAKKMS